MLKIRPEQLAVFDQADLEQFIQRMMKFQREQFPEETANIDDTQLNQQIRERITRAQRYNIVAKKDICDYLSLCRVFGADFGQTEDWAKSILSDPVLSSGKTRISRLYEAGMNILQPQKQ